MLSPRGGAHLGLGAACLVVVCSVAVLHTGAAEAQRALRAQPMTVAPDFLLTDSAGHSFSLSSHRGQAAVLCFTSINCPVSNDYASRIGKLARRYSADPRVCFVSVNVGKALPSGGRAALPLYLDPSAEVARRYAVEVTPSLFVIDGSGVIRYRGSLDDNRNGAQVQHNFCENALQDILHNRRVAVPLTAAIGCAILH